MEKSVDVQSQVFVGPLPQLLNNKVHSRGATNNYFKNGLIGWLFIWLNWSDKKKII